MADGQTEIIASQRPLGRHVEHDVRSRQHRAVTSPVLLTTRHERRCPAFDQGMLGSCTGNAMAGALMTDPYFRLDTTLGEPEAVELYMTATDVDGFPGSYPPDDTGSSGLAVAKAAVMHGYIASYGWAFGLEEALAALVIAPIIIGINWYSSFDNPTKTGEIKIGKRAYVRGGHEVVLDRINVESRSVAGCNSWGPLWGNLGRFHMTWATFGRLLAENGDATQFIDN